MRTWSSEARRDAVSPCRVLPLLSLVCTPIVFGSQFEGTWRLIGPGPAEPTTCLIRESGQQVSVRCDGKKLDGTPWHIAEEGTLETGRMLRTTGLGPNQRRFTVSRELAPNGAVFREVRLPDRSEEQATDQYYERVPDPIRCSDVGQIDFKNLTFGSEGLVFPFHDGVAEIYDWEGIAMSAENGTQPKPEFQAEIDLDKTVSPAPGVKVRFLRFELDHLGGSGWRNYVLGFACGGGVLREVFHREAISLRLESLNDDEITVSMLPFDGRNKAKPLVESGIAVPTRSRMAHTPASGG